MNEVNFNKRGQRTQGNIEIGKHYFKAIIQNQSSCFLDRLPAVVELSITNAEVTTPVMESAPIERNVENTKKLVHYLKQLYRTNQVVS